MEKKVGDMLRKIKMALCGFFLGMGMLILIRVVPPPIHYINVGVLYLIIGIAVAEDINKLKEDKK